jgi:hypothetical protein
LDIFLGAFVFMKNRLSYNDRENYCVLDIRINLILNIPINLSLGRCKDKN